EESVLRLRYPKGPEIDIRVGWLGADRARQTVLVGSDATVVYESAPETRLTVFRDGAAQIVELAPREPLRAELEHFVESARRGHGRLLAAAASGLRVVETLAAADRCLAARQIGRASLRGERSGGEPSGEVLDGEPLGGERLAAALAS